MGFADDIKERALVFDGSKGMMLQQRGLRGEEAAEAWNVSRPEEVSGIYEQYLRAGADVIQTNTFPGNRITLEKHGLGGEVRRLNEAGVRLARDAAAGTGAYVAAAVGPTGGFMQPAGELSFDDVCAAYGEQLKALEAAGADLLCFETFTDLGELRAALVAARENTALPFIASLSFDADGTTMSGNPAEACAAVCQAMGAAMVGANCSGGPESLMEPIRRMQTAAAVPLCVKPNAGMPEVLDGQVVYHETPAHFAAFAGGFIANGARLIGGCCGTTPAHIAALRAQVNVAAAPPLAPASGNAIASARQYLPLDGVDYRVNICEIEPFAAKIKAGRWDDVVDAMCDGEDEETGFHLLDFGALEMEPDGWALASELSLLVKKPIVLRTASPGIARAVLRHYPGRAGLVPAGQAPLLRGLAGQYGALVLDERFRPVG